jgi:hypothetical protein
MQKRLVPTVATLAVGAAFGVALVLSCSDDAPHKVDAATTCDCPASEPPLAGRIVTASSTVTIAAGAIDSAAAVCPPGSQILSGSCTGTNPSGTSPGLVLMESGFYIAQPTAWQCWFKNTGATSIDVKASAICLNPST